MTRFVIFGHGRSGTTLIVSLLDSHPGVACEGELLNPRCISGFRQRLIPLWRREPRPLLAYRALRRWRPAYGFKLLFIQAHAPESFARRLSRSGWKFVYVWRRDMLAQCLSAAVARETRRYPSQLGTPPPALNPVTIDPAFFLSKLGDTIAQRARSRALMATLPHCPVVFEDDLCDTDHVRQTADRIQSFLELPRHELSSPLQKTWDRPYSALIVNHDALVAAAHARFTTSELYDSA